MSDLKTYIVYSDKTVEDSSMAVRAATPGQAVELYVRHAMKTESVDLDDITNEKVDVIHLPETDTPGVLDWDGPEIRWTFEIASLRESLEMEDDMPMR